MRAEGDEISLFRGFPDFALGAKRTGHLFVVLKQCVGHERLQIAIRRSDDASPPNAARPFRTARSNKRLHLRAVPQGEVSSRSTNCDGPSVRPTEHGRVRAVARGVE